MVSLSTTQLSSKGQVVIPQEIRVRLGLKAGSRFVVVAERGVVMLKTIAPPARSEVDALLSRVRKQARRAGVRKESIRAAIRRARGGR